MGLKLHDIDDAERFVAVIATRSGLKLTFHDRQDLEQFLLVEVWRLSLRYEPGIIHKGFSTWAGTTLRKRCVDWQRSRFGRTKFAFKDHVYERPRTEFVSFDDPQHNRVVDALGTEPGDLEANWDETLRGLHAERDRTRARDLKILGARPRRRAPY
jgi:DNA-directed RNA polymerase specialized sigma24 family protein